MVEDSKLLIEAKIFISGATSEEAEEKFNLSRKTLQNHMNVYLKAKSDAYDGTGDINWKELYDAVNARKENNQQQGRIKGGTIGHRESSLSQSD